MGSTDVLLKIEIRTNDELKLWPDHAVLIDVSLLLSVLNSLHHYFTLRATLELKGTPFACMYIIASRLV